MNVQPTTQTPVAPAPRKSRRKWYLFGGFALLLVAAPTAYYFYAAWAGEREIEAIGREIDAEDPNWRWPDMVAALKPPPDERNSAVQILKAHGMIAGSSFIAGGKWDNVRNQPSNTRWSNAYLDPLRAAFGRLPKGAMEEAHKLKDMPEGGFTLPPVENPFAMNLDHVQKSRMVTYLLQLDATLKANDGDREGAAESCLAILNTADASKDHPFLIAQLVRIAEQSIALSAIERTLGQGIVTEASLAKLQTRLEKQVANDGLHAAMRGERAAGHQAYLNVRDGKLTLSSIFGGVQGKQGTMDHMLDTFPGVILNGYPEYLRLMTEQVRVCKLKDTERAEAFAKIEKQVLERRNNILIRMIMPATQKVAGATQRSQAMMRSAIAGLAAERFRLKHGGAWPRSLDDLVKDGLLKEVPRDPFDGKALRLKRTATGIVVYSVGYDKIDNGGRFNRDNPQADGFDLGFELWDPDRRGLPPPPEEEIPRQP